MKASCHCQAVRFTVESHEPVPFMRCYCSICRKTAGTGGFAVNLGADHATLKVDGMEEVSVYRATMEDGRQSSGHRHCKRCGTALWLWDPTLARACAPACRRGRHAAARAASVTHMMLGSKPDWVEANVKPGDESFDAYPQESLAELHRRNGVGD